MGMLWVVLIPSVIVCTGLIVRLRALPSEDMFSSILRLCGVESNASDKCADVLQSKDSLLTKDANLGRYE